MPITFSPSSSHKNPADRPCLLSLSQPWKSSFILLSMFSILFLCLLFLSLFLSLFYFAHHHHHRQPPPHNAPLTSVNSSVIHLACMSTRFPDICESSIAQSRSLPPNPTAFQITNSAIVVSTQNLETSQTMVKSILDASSENQNRSTAAKMCLEILSYSDRRIQSAVDALARGKIKDARAWMTAAHGYQYDCWSGLNLVNNTSLIDKTLAFLDTLIVYSSNALSMTMAYDNFGDNTASWAPPKTERDGFYGGSGSAGEGKMGFNGGFPSNLKADVTVCKDGNAGCYTTVQAAVDATPDNEMGRRFVIHIKEGL
ncbi:hypothetical protein SLE2022_292130 [Rubroshorea leprosula]